MYERILNIGQSKYITKYETGEGNKSHTLYVLTFQRALNGVRLVGFSYTST